MLVHRVMTLVIANRIFVITPLNDMGVYKKK